MQLPSLFLQTSEAAPVGLLLVNGTGTIVHANAAALELFGGGPLEGKSVEALVPASARDHHPQHRSAYQKSPAKRTMGSGRDLEAVRPDGSTFPVEVGLNPFVLDGANLVLCSVISLERRAADEASRVESLRQALHAQRLESLARLAGGVAHDFNNLLAAILGNTTFARSLAQGNTTLDETLADVQEAAEQARVLSAQMLAYAGGQPTERVLVDVVEEVRSSSALLRSLAGRNVHLNVRLPDEQLHTVIDPAQLRQLLMNLVTNSAQATAGVQDGTIGIMVGRKVLEGLEQFPGSHATLSGSFVTIGVSDNGSGMPEKTRMRLFEPFVSTKGRGRGLGLAACHGILRAAEGGASVYSEPGRGTTIQFYLKEEVLVGASEADDSAQANEPRNQTVLVIDDDEKILRFARRSLEAGGFRVLTAQAGAEGVELARAHDVDVVLLDLMMPDMTGLEVLSELRKLGTQAQVVICSGYSEQQIESQVAGRTFHALLQKPFAHSTLIEVVSRACAERKD